MSDVSRAMHEIQSDGYKLLGRIESALESQSWETLHRLHEELRELAIRGMHRRSIQMARDIAVQNQQPCGAGNE